MRRSLIQQCLLLHLLLLLGTPLSLSLSLIFLFLYCLYYLSLLSLSLLFIFICLSYLYLSCLYYLFLCSHEFVIFKKKVPTKTRKQPLFRFDNSRHALSVSSYIKEQRDKELAAQVQVRVLWVWSLSFNHAYF